MEPTAAEVAGRAVVREFQPHARRNEGARMARRVEESLAVNEWRQGLENIRNPVERSKSAEHIEEIGVNYNPGTGEKARNPQEQGRYDRANAGERLSRRFLEEGYEALNPRERRRAREQVITRAMRDSILRPYLNGLTAAQRDEFAERHLNNPEFEKYAREARTEADERSVTIKDSAINQAETDVLARQLEFERARDERAEIDRRIAETNTVLTSFGSNAPGTLGHELTNLRTNITAITRGAEIAEAQYTSREALANTRRVHYDRLSGNPRTPPADVNTARLAMETAVADAQAAAGIYNTERARLNRLPELEERLNSARQDARTLAADRITKENERRLAERTTQVAQRQEQNLKARRTGEEEEIAVLYENVFANAASKILLKHENDVLERYGNDIETRRQEINTGATNVMLDVINTRWEGRVRRRGIFAPFRHHPIRPINRRLVDEDLTQLLDEGPEVLARRIAEEMLPGVRNEATGRNYQARDIEDLLANHEIMNSVSEDVVKQLLARKAMAGGISREDAYIITNARWGQQAIEHALEKNEAFNTQVEDLINKSGLQRNSFMERFSQAIRRRPWLLGALLVGAPLAAAAGPLGVAGLLGVSAAEIAGVGAAAGAVGVGYGYGKEALTTPRAQEEMPVRGA